MRTSLSNTPKKGMQFLERVNQQLIREYGYFDSVRANWRVVFANDQFEKRWVKNTKEGFELLNPVVEERPKYRQWASDKFILERLLPNPTFTETDLVEPISYEPVWVFETDDGKPIDISLVKSPRFFDACKHVINAVNEQSAKQLGIKYKDPEASMDKEARKALLDEKVKVLFPNETPVGDALAYKDGVSLAGLEIPKKVS